MLAVRNSGLLCFVGYWPGNLIWSWTMSRIADSLKPSARACANAASGFGPIVAVDPAAASVWQPAHCPAPEKSWRPWFTSAEAPVTDPPVPHAASMRTTATPPAAAESFRSKLRGRPVGRLHVGDGLVARGVDREHAVEPGDLEDLGDVPVAANERQLPVVGAQPLDPSDEDAEGGRIDERRVAEVDDHLLSPLADHLEELLLELRRGVEIHLAREGDHVGVVSQLLRL